MPSEAAKPTPYEAKAGSSTLRRNYLSIFENIAQTLGTMAPTGTLGVVIPLIIGTTGNGTWLLLLGVVGVYLLIVLNINVFATQHASACGLGTYASLGLGRRAGTATKWIYFGAMLFSAAGCAPSAAYYACLVIAQTSGLPNTAPLQGAVTAAVVALAWWTAWRDIKLSSDAMIVIEVTSLSIMAAILALALSHGGPWVDRPQLTLQGAGPQGFSAGLVLAFITMAGFESATTLGEEAKQAERTIPRAIAACVLPVGILYVAVTYLLVALGRTYGIALDKLEAPFDTIARANRFPLLGSLSSIGIAMSYLACTLGSMNAGARTLYSLSEDGLFFPSFGRAHPVNATPHRAISAIGAIAVAVPLGLLAVGTPLVSCILYLTQLASLGFIATYFMVCLAAPSYLRATARLSGKAVAASLITLLILAAVLVQSVYPAPPEPGACLPYIFASVVAAGFVLSLRMEKRASPTRPR